MRIDEVFNSKQKAKVRSIVSERMTKKLLSLVFLYSIVFANDDNSRISVYIQPISMMTSFFNEYFLYLTVEYPLNESSSIIVNPSFIYSENLGSMSDYEKNSSYYSRIGSGVGIRRFIGDKISDGFYLQLMPSVYRFRNDFKNGTIIDILGYIGYSFKSSNGGIFIDMGIGLASLSLPSYDVPFWLLGGSSGYNFISTDINLGVGFAF